MTNPAAKTQWRRATAVILLVSLAWQALWLVAAYFASGGREYSDDVAPAYLRYLADPFMLLTDRHREVFGGAVAAPLLPVQLAFFYDLFAAVGDFVALRLTMLIHLLMAIGVGFAVAFRSYGAPRDWRQWLQACGIVILPVAWITSVVTVQDDSIAAAWAGLCLVACVWLGPVWAAIAAGCGMFFGKILMALAFLGLWIASPGRRWGVAAVGAAFALALIVLLWLRDGGFGAYSAYAYPPYMGASAYGAVWLVAGEFDLWAARNLSAVLTCLTLAGFTWVALRRHLSTSSAVVGVHMLFLITYFGAMPEYYVWFVPFLVVTLWSCCRRGMWATFAMGWLSGAFAYGYKLVYGVNIRFPGGKMNLKSWVAENVRFDLDLLQVGVGITAVACTLVFGVCVLLFDPASQLATQQRTDPVR